jgi:hypothetical protein
MIAIIVIQAPPGDQHNFVASNGEPSRSRGTGSSCSDHDTFHSADSHNLTFFTKHSK